MVIIISRIKEKQAKKTESPEKKGKGKLSSPTTSAATAADDDDPYGVDTDEDEQPGKYR